MLNDLYGFHREFDMHAKARNPETLRNAINVLMSGYKYTEEEARSILRKEILKLEDEMMEQYETWEASAAHKSKDLRRYVVLSIHYLGGLNYWMSHSLRYHGKDLNTSEQDRAQAIGKSSKGIWELNNYPPPRTATSTDSMVEKPQSGVITVLNEQLVDGSVERIDNEPGLDPVSGFPRACRKPLRERLTTFAPGTWASSTLQELPIKALQKGPLPEHMAFVADGNQRWAKQRNITIAAGHLRGEEVIEEVTEVCYKCGIKVLTFYIFSIENFKRPKEQVDWAMEVAKRLLKTLSRRGGLLDRYGVRMRVLGRLDLLRPEMVKTIQHTTSLTRNYGDNQVNLCVASAMSMRSISVSDMIS